MVGQLVPMLQVFIILTIIIIIITIPVITTPIIIIMVNPRVVGTRQ